MIRFLWRILTAILCLASLALVLIITPLGLKLSISLANHISQNIHIEVKGLSGTLLGPIQAKEIIVTQDNNQFQITNPQLTWQVLHLFAGQIRVQKLSADHVHLFLGKNSTPTETDLTKHLPHITIQSLLVNTLTIVSSLRDQAIVLTDIHGSALSRPHKVAINISTHVALPGINQASIHLNGLSHDYTFSARIEGPHTHTVLIGSGTQQSLTASIPPGTFLHGSLSGNLNLSWLPRWQWKAQLSLKGVHLNKWEKRLPIISSAEVSTHGYLSTEKQADFYYRVHMDSDEIKLKSQGHIGSNKKQITWNINANNLNSFVSSLPSGHIQSSGTWHNGNTTGTLNASNIRWGKYSLGEINTSWSAVMSPFYIKTASLHAEKIHRGDLSLDINNATITGDRQHAILSADLSTDFPYWGLKHARFKLDSTRKEGNQWQGRWQYFDMQGPYGKWTLGAHPLVTIEPSHIKQPLMCWTHSQRALCTHWSWLNSRWAVHIEGQNLPLDTWLSRRIAHTTAVGSNRLSLDVSDTIGKPVAAKAHIELSHGILTLPRPYHPIHIHKAIIDSTLDEDHWILNSSAQFEHNGQLQVKSTVKRTNSQPWSQRDIHTSVTLKSDNFTPLQHLVPELYLGNSRINASVLFTGSFAKPIINGTLSIPHARATIDALGTTIDPLSLNSQWTNNHFTYHFSSLSPISPLSLDGTGKLDTEFWQLSTQAHILGHDVLVFNQPDYIVYANPNLNATFTDHNLTLKGELTLLNTTIKPTTLTEAHSIPSDVILIDSGKEKIKQHEHLGLDIALKLGNHVDIDTSIFDASLTGQVQLTKKPGPYPLLGNGAIIVNNGKMNILGNHYFVNNATLSYTNKPITEPSLDIKIFRLIKRNPLLRRRKYGPRTVGLHITGPYRYPIILPFSSDSSLSNNDIVSYFAFNRPSNTGQPFHAAALLNALAELPNNGGNLDPETRSALIKQAIGFSELGVQSGASLASIGAPISGYDDAFVVGRYLSPNIYLRYTRGISSAYSIYQVRYNMTSSLSIQTESGTLGNGADLLYSFTSLLHPKNSALTK